MSYPGFPHPYNPVIAVVIWTTVPLAVLVSSSRDKKPMDAELEASVMSVSRLFRVGLLLRLSPEY